MQPPYFKKGPRYNFRRCKGLARSGPWGAVCNTTGSGWVSILTTKLKEGCTKGAAKSVVSRVKFEALLVTVPCSWAVLAAGPQSGQGQIFLQQFSSGQTYTNDRHPAHGFEVPWMLRVPFRAALGLGLATNIQQCLTHPPHSSCTGFSFSSQEVKAEQALQDHTLPLKSVFFFLRVESHYGKSVPNRKKKIKKSKAYAL